jgi:hypothetical protein
MPGLVPRIPVFQTHVKDVAGQDNPGHDQVHGSML